MIAGLLDIALLVVITWLCWRGYRDEGSWVVRLGAAFDRFYLGHGYWRQLLTFAPLAVGWLLLCHRVNKLGWHATAAGGILLAMTMGLHAMRSMEQRQKAARNAAGRDA